MKRLLIVLCILAFSVAANAQRVRAYGAGVTLPDGTPAGLDTLASVTARGATTTTPISINPAAAHGTYNPITFPTLDPTVNGDYSFTACNATWFGEPDPLLFWGYNVTCPGPTVANTSNSQAALYYGIEGDYKEDAVNHVLETYVQYTANNGTDIYRPFHVGVVRNTGVVSVGLRGDSITFSDKINTGGAYMQYTPTAIYAGGTTYQTVYRIDFNNATGLAQRNAAGNGYKNLIYLDASDVAHVGQGPVSTTGALTSNPGAQASAAVPADALAAVNTTASTSGATVQESPAIRLESHAWNTSADVKHDWRLYSLPVSAATTTDTLKFGYSSAGGAETFPATLTNGGVFTTLGAGSFGGRVSAKTDLFIGTDAANTQLVLQGFSPTGGPGVAVASGYGNTADRGYWGTYFLFVGASATSTDLGIARAQAGVAKITDGNAGIGALLASRLVEANTAGVGAPNILTAVESGTVETNEGATAQNYHTLPTAAAGLTFTFIVQDADGIRVVANTGDTIRIAANVSASAGYIQNSTIGSVITLTAINATEWVATSVIGTWTIDS